MKKAISLIMSLTFIFTVFSTGNISASAASYNATAAVAYAEKNWDNGIEMCAGFVSNCLQAGGIDVMERSVGNLYNALKGTYGTSYVLTTDGPYIYMDDNTGKLSVGDPVFYYCNSCKSFQHAILCGGSDSGGRMTDYAHNNAHHNTTTYISWGCPGCGAINWTMYSVHIGSTAATYSVKYDANGGSGAPAAQTKTQGSTLTLSATKPTRSGYTFKCWNTKSDGSGTNYNPGSSYTANANVTLYAIWTHTHSYTKTITKAATCTSAGTAKYTCSCGKSYTESIAATGHKSSWVYTKRPSVYSSGTKRQECSVCHTALSANTTVAKVTGDVTGDSKVNSADALLILKFSTGVSSPSTETIKLNADPNGDGKINSSDALLVLKISTGSIKV